MALTFPPQGTPAWYAYIEQLVSQHRVDVQRLWKVAPQLPENQQGVAFTGPTSPGALGGTPGAP